MMIRVLLIMITIGVWLQGVDTSVLPLGDKSKRYKIGKIHASEIIKTAGNKTVKIGDIAKEFSRKKVCVIGEMHDSMKCHDFQLELIKEIFKTNKKIVVGFEFFNRNDDAALKDYIDGKTNEDQFLKSVGWYKKGSWNFRYTKVILDFLRENKIAAVGLNVPRTILRKISRKGFSTLSKEEQKLFPGIKKPSAEHRFFISTIFGSMAAASPKWFERIYTAQKCWDIVMAESMKKALKKRKGYKGIIIAGANHVAYELGIPFRYRKSNRRASIMTVMPVVVEGEGSEGIGAMHPSMKKMKKKKKPFALFGSGVGTYVFGVQAYSKPHFPDFGMKFRDSKKVKGIAITRVSKGSFADRKGLMKGDLVTEVCGKKFDSAEELRKFMDTLNYGDKFTINTVRKSEFKELKKKDF